MVWFWNKRQKALTDRLDKITGKVSEITVKIGEVADKIGGIADKVGGISGLAGDLQGKAMEILSSLEKAHAKLDGAVMKISRHDDALTDMMESFEDLSDQEGEKLDRLESLISRANDSRIREIEKKQADLLNVVMAYQAQLGYLHSMLAKNPAWSEQIALASDKLSALTESVGLQSIADTGKRVNYTTHEVIEAIATKDPTKDKTVAQVYEPGTLYYGSVLKKAKVAAYKLEKEVKNEHYSWH